MIETNCVGCGPFEEEFEVNDDAGDEEIAEMAAEAVAQHVSYGYAEIKEPSE